MDSNPAQNNLTKLQTIYKDAQHKRNIREPKIQNQLSSDIFSSHKYLSTQDLPPTLLTLLIYVNTFTKIAMGVSSHVMLRDLIKISRSSI